MINAIVFSKDRPAQVDLLLKSLHQNVPGVFKTTVLWAGSDLPTQNLYRSLREEHKDVKFVSEGLDFQDTLIDLLERTEESEQVFFTDDDIVYRPFHQSFVTQYLEDPEVVCFSLRLGRNTVIQDQYTGQLTTMPMFDQHHYDDVLVWDWRSVPNHMNFGYPMSVDGHVFETNYIRGKIQECKFHNPNSLECQLASKTHDADPFMACFEHSVLVNTPLNRVQETCQNRSGIYFGLDTAYANKMFQEGKRLDYNSINFKTIKGCHQELQVKFC